MTEGDGLGILVFFTFIAGTLWFIIGEFKNRKKKPKTSILPISEAISDDSEDRELNLEDSEGDGLFFDEPLFPPELDDLGD